LIKRLIITSEPVTKAPTAEHGLAAGSPAAATIVLTVEDVARIAALVAKGDV
jgi:hypothetical protein